MKAKMALAGLMLAGLPAAALAQSPTTSRPPLVLAQVQGAPVQNVPSRVVSTAEYASYAFEISDFLERSSRLAVQKGQDRRIRNFARAEVNEQLGLLTLLGEGVVTGTVGGHVNIGPPPGSGRTFIDQQIVPPAGSRVISEPMIVETIPEGQGGWVNVGPPPGSGRLVIGRSVMIGQAGPATTTIVTGADTMSGEEALAQLEAMPAGRAFDRAFVRAQIVAHRQGLMLHASYAQTGADPSLRIIAENAAPVFREHLAALVRLGSSLTPVRR